VLLINGRQAVDQAHDSPTLADRHREHLHGAGIADDVIVERGYRTAEATTDLIGFGFGRARAVAAHLPGFVIPVRGALDGGGVTYRVLRSDNESARYHAPKGARNVVDVPVRVREQLGDPSLPLWPGRARPALRAWQLLGGRM
jgi:hypothetical protein